MKGYDDRFFIGSIALISLTIAYVVFGCPEARKPETTSCAESTAHDGFLLSPCSRIKILVVNFTTALLLPFSMFRPRRSPSGGRSWNMTLCGLALFLYTVSTASRTDPLSIIHQLTSSRGYMPQNTSTHQTYSNGIRSRWVVFALACGDTHLFLSSSATTCLFFGFAELPIYSSSSHVRAIQFKRTLFNVFVQWFSPI